MPSSGRTFPLPRNLVVAARQEGREAWLATVPFTVADLAERWSLTVGAPFQPGGQTAWVAPARDADGDELVLKVGWRHPEALQVGGDFGVLALPQQLRVTSPTGI